jgi:hypothetical protein
MAYCRQSASSYFPHCHHDRESGSGPPPAAQRGRSLGKKGVTNVRTSVVLAGLVAAALSSVVVQPTAWAAPSSPVQVVETTDANAPNVIDCRTDWCLSQQHRTQDECNRARSKALSLGDAAQSCWYSSTYQWAFWWMAR